MMDTGNLVGEDLKLSSKGRQKWNIFQRGGKSKASAEDLLNADPVELQRVSFATSIDDLPERPSAFKQVLRQIGASKNSPGGLLKMTRVPNFKKMVREGRGSSPQGRTSIGSTSSVAPTGLDVSQNRPRSSSNASLSGVLTEPTFKSTSNEPERALSTNNNDKSNNPSDSAGKLIGSGLPAVTSAGPAGLLLVESPIQASSSSLLGASSSDIMPGAVGNYDVVDGSPAINEQQRNKQLAEHLKQKIIKTSEAIKAEQSTRDENVAEYLKLATNADKQQASRIKIVFEKKNQKSNNSISQLQKKLDSYHRRLKELESNGTARPGRLRDVGANIQGVVDTVKGGLSGLQHATQNIAHKPKDLASKWKNRFGSADNLSTLKDDDETEDQLLRSGSADDVSSASGSTDNFASIGPEGLSMDETPNHGRTPSASGADSPTSGIGRRVDAEQIRKVATQLLTIKSELQETRKTQRELELEWERKKNELQSTITQLLDEERMRFEVQVNDLTEMQQREVANLKQELSSMEEKIEYHANERARDVQEALESCQTRIAKMELQQQQLVSVSVEGLENQNAKALLGKLINLLLSVMAVLLVLVSTVSGLLMPFVKSQRRLLATVIVAITFVVIYNNWSYFVSWYDALVGR